MTHQQQRRTKITVDITGHKFGKLTALKKVGIYTSPAGHKIKKWDCICDCGNAVNLRLDSLRNGSTKSCGCLKVGNVSHAMSKSVEYQSLARIKDRCYNVASSDYYLYGGRGITVCDRWLNSFVDFYADMGDRPKNHSIDRINTNGNYEPSNCRWASVKTQSRNKRNNRFYELNGENMCVADWAKKLGITFSSLSERLEKWTLEKSLTTYKKGSST